MKKKKMERGIRNPKDYYTRLNLFRTSKRKKKAKKKKKKTQEGGVRKLE